MVRQQFRSNALRGAQLTPAAAPTQRVSGVVSGQNPSGGSVQGLADLGENLQGVLRNLQARDKEKQQEIFAQFLGTEEGQELFRRIQAMGDVSDEAVVATPNPDISREAQKLIDRNPLLQLVLPTLPEEFTKALKRHGRQLFEAEVAQLLDDDAALDEIFVEAGSDPEGGFGAISASKIAEIRSRTFDAVPGNVVGVEEISRINAQQVAFATGLAKRLNDRRVRVIKEDQVSAVSEKVTAAAEQLVPEGGRVNQAALTDDLKRIFDAKSGSLGKDDAIEATQLGMGDALKSLVEDGRPQDAHSMLASLEKIRLRGAALSDDERFKDWIRSTRIELIRLEEALDRRETRDEVELYENARVQVELEIIDEFDRRVEEGDDLSTIREELLGKAGEVGGERAGLSREQSDKLSAHAQKFAFDTFDQYTRLAVADKKEIERNRDAQVSETIRGLVQANDFEAARRATMLIGLEPQEMKAMIEVIDSFDGARSDAARKRAYSFVSAQVDKSQLPADERERLKAELQLDLTAGSALDDLLLEPGADADEAAGNYFSRVTGAIDEEIQSRIARRDEERRLVSAAAAASVPLSREQVASLSEEQKEAYDRRVKGIADGRNDRRRRLVETGVNSGLRTLAPSLPEQAAGSRARELALSADTNRLQREMTLRVERLEAEMAEKLLKDEISPFDVDAFLETEILKASDEIAGDIAGIANAELQSIIKISQENPDALEGMITATRNAPAVRKRLFFNEKVDLREARNKNVPMAERLNLDRDYIDPIEDQYRGRISRREALSELSELAASAADVDLASIAGGVPAKAELPSAEGDRDKLFASKALLGVSEEELLSRKLVFETRSTSFARLDPLSRAPRTPVDVSFTLDFSNTDQRFDSTAVVILSNERLAELNEDVSTLDKLIEATGVVPTDESRRAFLTYQTRMNQLVVR